MAVHADAGSPMPREAIATPEKQFIEFETFTRQLSVRNTGTNTLWMSFDQKSWHDVASGTSWDDRVNVKGFWVVTQTGSTSFVAIGIQLIHGVKSSEAAASEQRP